MDIFASSRAEKTLILQEIIQNLPIDDIEKDLYYFSMEILDSTNFDLFFEKIISEFHTNKNQNLTFTSNV